MLSSEPFGAFQSRWAARAVGLLGLVAGSGHAVIRFPVGAKVIMTDGSIEGHAGRFVVDTGASYVALTASFAKQMGLAIDAWPEIQVSTAAGTKKSKLGMVKSVEVQGVKAGHIEAAVIDDLPGAQGLLGVSRDCATGSSGSTPRHGVSGSA